MTSGMTGMRFRIILESTSEIAMATMKTAVAKMMGWLNQVWSTGKASMIRSPWALTMKNTTRGPSSSASLVRAGLRS